jgi:tetratricopeptide (TPR) repeat protein
MGTTWIQMERQIKPTEVISILNHAADEASKAGHHEDCLRLLKQSALQSARYFGTDHKMYAFSLIKLAETYIELQKFKEAVDSYNEALAILLQVLTPSHMSLGIVYRNLTELYRTLNMYAKAKETELKAIEIFSKNHQFYS